MGRHRHLTCVRSDGLSAVLRPLLDDRHIVAATLVDADSGLVLDGWVEDAGEHPALADLELLGAAHADMVRAALAVAPTLAELSVSTDDGHHHLLHAVPDPHGERLVVAVVVRGAPRHVAKARLRLRTVSVEALTAGPTLQRRPVNGSWVVEPPGPDGATVTNGPGGSQDDALEHPHDRSDGSRPSAPAPSVSLAPLSAMSPRGPALPPGPGATPPPTLSSVASSADGVGQRSPGRTSPLS